MPSGAAASLDSQPPEGQIEIVVDNNEVGWIYLKIPDEIGNDEAALIHPGQRYHERDILAAETASSDARPRRRL